MGDDAVFEIRAYTPDDYEACRALWVELTQHHRDIYQAQCIGGSDPGSDFDEYLGLETRVVSWVATRGGVAVGLTGLLIDDGVAEIEPVIVATERRGHGIGTALVEYAIKEARRRGVTMVNVRPVARNESALRFFHDAGFTNLGHVELFMRLGESSTAAGSSVEIHGRAWTD